MLFSNIELPPLDHGRILHPCKGKAPYRISSAFTHVSQSDFHFLHHSCLIHSIHIHPYVRHPYVRTLLRQAAHISEVVWNNRPPGEHHPKDRRKEHHQRTEEEGCKPWKEAKVD